MKTIGLLFAACLLHAAWAAYQPDLVTSLPGVANFASLGYNQYSGYLNGSEDGNIQLHYWFVESQRSPTEDPLVLWLNGGPGCSSLDGYLYEHGPLLVAEDGLTLNVNPWAWNRVANVIYLESPACVGFSYAADMNCTTDDDKTAEENYNSVLNFMEKFPEFKGNKLYITGESYGGVYVPTLTYNIFKNLATNNLNLIGFATGNGLLNTPNNTNTMIDFGYGHGIVSADLHAKLLSSCCDNSGAHCNYLNGAASSKICEAHVVTALTDLVVNPKLDIYDVEGPCYYGTPGTEQEEEISKGSFAKAALARKLVTDGLPFPVLTDAPIVPCIDATGANIYLNTVAVREALHISPNALPVWAICNQDFTYTKQYHTMAPFFTTLLNGGIQGMVYNGDIDAACNVLGGSFFVNELGYNPTSKYCSWLVGEQIGGWTRSYGDMFQFVTVRGAGHEVPLYKPRAALQMFNAFLDNNYEMDQCFD